MGVSRIQIRRGTSSEWSTANPTLYSGEMGYDTTLGKIKIGNGSTPWNTLHFYNENVFRFDSSINGIVYYDTARSKWLSDAILVIEVCRNGNLGVGTSFRTGEGLPTSVTPVLLERNCTLVGVAASTSAAERFTMRVDDVSTGGSGSTLAINYEAPGPASTTRFIRNNLNQDYNANDQLDIYVLSSFTGAISNPRVRLLFRYRV